MTAASASLCRGLVIAAPASGSGKTLLTLGILRALKNQGAGVGSAKVGPDYIDPAFHTAATGRACINLDPWAMRRGLRQNLFKSVAGGAEIVVCEGVMGLFDGATATEGSTADLASEAELPVILLVDARAQAASAAAIVQGFATLRDNLTIGGVIFNHVGSDRHRGVISDAMAHYLPEVPVLGFLPRKEDLSLPSRHLGLVQAGEHEALEAFLDRAAALIAEHIDLDRLVQIATPLTDVTGGGDTLPLTPLGQRIAVAQDQAFAFSYAHVLDGWRDAGAEVLPFSPLNDESPPPNADAVYLPGGYPELHAGTLAGGQKFLSGLCSAAERGSRVFGECGGFMVLGDGLVDADGERHAMAGLLPLETSFAKRRLHLGYRQAELCHPEGVNGGLGDRAYRGHEFHYASVTSSGDAEALFHVADATGTDLGTVGMTRGSVAGSFIHLVDRCEP